MIIDKSPKYGCHFFLALMVIWGTVRAPPYFCLLLGTKKELLLLCPGESRVVTARPGKTLLKADISPL